MKKKWKNFENICDLNTVILRKYFVIMIFTK